MIKQPSENKVHLFSLSWFFLVIIILFVVFVRMRLSEFPLERDEGEYAYMGQLILNGVPPYSAAYSMKFPGTDLMYALVMSIFGQTTQGIHIGLIVVNCATILLVFLLSRQLVNDIPAAIAGGTYAVLSLSPSVLGFAAHATHFVILPAVGGTLLLLNALKKERFYLYFLTGILFGTSLLMKQPGIFFVLFGVAYILYYHVYYRADHTTRTFFYKLGAYSLGASLPLLISVLWLYAYNVFDRFWFWTVVYASIYGSQVPLSAAVPSFKDGLASVINGFSLLWILSGLGLIVTFFHHELKTKKVFVFLFILFSFLSVCLGFHFRDHYFVMLLPAVAILVALFIDFLTSLLFKLRLFTYMGVGIFIAAALVGIVGHKEYFFKDDPAKLSRSIYGREPFPESVEVAKFIEARSAVNDTIAVLGSEPQIYFYAKRRSSTGYIYAYSLMEKHEYSLIMQKETINQIESSKPKFIVFTSVENSWFRRLESETYIFDWLYNYVSVFYDLVGVVDIISPDMTVYRWYDDAKSYTRQSPSYLLIYERN